MRKRDGSETTGDSPLPLSVEESIPFALRPSQCEGYYCAFVEEATGTMSGYRMLWCGIWFFFIAVVGFLILVFLLGYTPKALFPSQVAKVTSGILGAPAVAAFAFVQWRKFNRTVAIARGALIRVDGSARLVKFFRNDQAAVETDCSRCEWEIRPCRVGRWSGHAAIILCNDIGMVIACGDGAFVEAYVRELPPRIRDVLSWKSESIDIRGFRRLF